MRAPAHAPPVFSERAFYLREFRGRTLALAGPSSAFAETAPLRKVLALLGRNGTRVVVLCTRAEPLRPLVPAPLLGLGRRDLVAEVWRRLRAASAVGIVVGGGRAFVAVCAELVVRLRVHKLVWLDPRGGLQRPDGERLSFVDRSALGRLRGRGEDRGRGPLIERIGWMLDAGVASVNLCPPAGLERELLSYAGSGTLFTQGRYVEVRPLGVDDFDQAHALHERGVREGYLAPRRGRELDRLLAGGFGAFVDGKHLAGIAALVRHPRARMLELASLYTLTRFQGEGVGHHLVRFGADRARAEGARALFACTTSAAVARFFESEGFERVVARELPASKWRGYDPERRRRLFCLLLRFAERSRAKGRPVQGGRVRRR